MTIPSQTYKCTCCGETKPLTPEYFHKMKTGPSHDRKDRFQTQCKKCILAKLGTPENQKRSREYQREWRKSIREEAFNHYGCKCVCCGEVTPQFLTLDHINNDGYEFRSKIFSHVGRKYQGGAGVHTYRWLIRNNYPDGFQVLCMNCNFGKRMNNGVCPHVSRCNDQGVVPIGSSDPKLRETDVEEKRQVRKIRKSGGRKPSKYDPEHIGL